MPHSRFVYVVDDDDSVRASTIALLTAAGMRVRAYASGDALLKNLVPSDSGCILLDVHMPGQSGFQVLESLRKMGIGMPVILFSGRADSQTELLAMQSGAAALLPKPIAAALLVAAIRRLLPAERLA
jgi:FixJ family two-component response regulator